MLVLRCPYCGPRSQDEFSYAGAVVQRPPDDAGQALWHDYVYLRQNPQGVHAEYWQHTLGCQMVFPVRRDTLTHRVDDDEVQP